MPAFVLFIVTCFLLAGCSNTDDPRYLPSNTSVPVSNTTFIRYQESVRDWLLQNRAAVSTDINNEININSPFQCGANDAKKGVLLVHGLGDSPFFMRDVASVLCEQGFLVRAILLQGHGSKPGDMKSVDYSVWHSQVTFHTEELAKSVDQLWLGGFSTGANLTTVVAYEREYVTGLLLFSPAFNSRFSASWLAPWLVHILPWPNFEEEDNPTRYNSVPMKGFAAYQKSVTMVNRRLDEGSFDRPVFMVVPEADSVVDTQGVLERFATRFTHSQSKLLWLGENKEMPEKAIARTMKIPQQRIDASSHMAPLFKSDNVIYGIHGSLRICDNGQIPAKTKRCEEGEEVWFGPWGWQIEGKPVARLTYNPYFDYMSELMLDVVKDTY